jgi:TPR repeat protein
MLFVGLHATLQDKASALRLYEQAATAGSAAAAYNLGTALLAAGRKALRRQVTLQHPAGTQPSTAACGGVPAAGGYQGAGSQGSGGRDLPGLSAAVLGVGGGNDHRPGIPSGSPTHLGRAVLDMLAGQLGSANDVNGSADQETAKAMWWLRKVRQV